MAKQTPEIRKFILETARDHPDQVIDLTSAKFDMNRRAAGWHVRELVEQGQLVASGSTRNRKYEIPSEITHNFSYSVNNKLAEDIIWVNDIEPLLKNFPNNVTSICQHGLTEMVNNVIDHSESKIAIVICAISPLKINLSVVDTGIGIFQKIKNVLGLSHERHALLELAKGKLTTDKANHTGEGIFFTSRIFDAFNILSSNSLFHHTEPDEDWFFEEIDHFRQGTHINMAISTFATRTVQEVFDRFAGPDEYTFSSTHVPLKLAKFGNENLVSRSQAKRVLARFEQFNEVMLDFDGIDTIGQAFADEIFRVFANAHPEIQFLVKDLSPQIENMIRRAQSGLNEGIPKVFENKPKK